MKTLKLRTKIEAATAVLIILSLVFLSYSPYATRTFSSSNDDIYTKIICSNGNSYTATGANIQTAINSLTSGGTVTLPSGTITASGLTLSHNIRLTGQGNSTILSLNANDDMIEIANKHGWEIDHLTIDMNNGSSGYNNGIDVTGTASYQGKIHDVYMTDGAGSLIYLEDGTHNISIHDVWCVGIGRWHGYYPSGIRIDGYHCTVDNVYCKDCFGSGVWIEAQAYGTLSGGHCISNIEVTGYTDTGIGMEGENAEKTTITNVHIYNLNSTAYLAPEGSYSTGIRLSDKTELSNFDIDNVYYAGIRIYGNQTSIMNGRIGNVQHYYGIMCQSSVYVHNITISGVKIYGCPRGIVTRSNTSSMGGRDFIISGNICYDDDYGIDVPGGLRFIITDNICDGATADIRCDAGDAKVDNNIGTVI